MTVFSWVLFLILAFIIGYVHTDIAIRMLFRPHRDIRLWGIGWQGLIPRRKPELAKKLGDIVVNQLLQEERIVARLHQPDMMEGLRRALKEVVDRLLEREAGSIYELLPPVQREAVRAMGVSLLVSLAHEGERWLASEAGVAAAREQLRTFLARTPSDLPPERQKELRDLASAGLRALLAHPELAGPLQQILDRAVVYLANTGTPIGEMLPSDVRPMLVDEMSHLTPILLERFADTISSPENVARVQEAVRAGIETELTSRENDPKHVEILRWVGSRIFRAQIMAKADEMVATNVPMMRSVLLAPENQERVNGELAKMVERFLARTVADVLTTIPAATIDRVYARVAANLAGYLQRPEVADTLEPLVTRCLDGFWTPPLLDLLHLGGIDDAQIDLETGHFCQWLAADRIGGLVASEAPAWTDNVMNLPLGRVSSLLTSERRDAILEVMFEKLPTLIDPVVPVLLKQLDMRTLVEQQINAFSCEELENLIISVAQKELFTITWLGGLLGALIAVAQLLF